MPRISVVIPLFNKVPYIERTLRSVLGQTYKDFEVIVVDDGSTDDGARIVEAIDDQRIRLLRQENAGAAAATNTGVRAARGQWIAFLDADDEWMTEKLAMQMKAIRCHPDIVWAAGGFIRTKDNRIICYEEKFKKQWFESEFVLRDALVPLACGLHICTITVMIKRQVLLEIGGVDESICSGKDLDLWVRLALKYPKLIYIEKPLANYHVDLEGAMTVVAVTQTNESLRILANKIISQADTVDPSRGQLLIQFARIVILRRAQCLLWAGRNDLAGEILSEFGLLNLGWTGKLLKAWAYIPGFISVTARRTIKLARKVVR